MYICTCIHIPTSDKPQVKEDICGNATVILLYKLTKSSFNFCVNVYPVGVEAWNWNSRSSMMLMMSMTMAAASSLGGIISSAASSSFSSSSRASIQCSVERQALFNRIAPVYDGVRF